MTSDAKSVIPEGFEPPIFWAVTRGIIQLCYGTKPIYISEDVNVAPESDAKLAFYLIPSTSKRHFFDFYFHHILESTQKTLLHKLLVVLRTSSSKISNKTTTMRLKFAAIAMLMSVSASQAQELSAYDMNKPWGWCNCSSNSQGDHISVTQQPTH